MAKYFKIFTFLIFLPLQLLPQENNIKFKHISGESGLPQNWIHSIVQDDYGFMWFSGEDGLIKYDGYKFKTFRHETDNQNSLSHSYVWTIFKGSSGKLWLGTEGGGLNMFDPETDSFIHYMPETKNPFSINGTHINALMEDRSGILWLGAKGLNKFDPDDEIEVRFQEFDGKQIVNVKILERVLH